LGPLFIKLLGLHIKKKSDFLFYE